MASVKVVLSTARWRTKLDALFFKSSILEVIFNSFIGSFEIIYYHNYG